MLARRAQLFRNLRYLRQLHWCGRACRSHAGLVASPMLCRDRSEEIRATCIGGIGAWVRALPAAFLTDQYLKYLAWALSDRVSFDACAE